MQIVPGAQYTFSFRISGTYLGFGSPADDAITALESSGFPLSMATGKTQGGIGGILGGDSIEITATYNGTATDDGSLGAAMASTLTDNFTALTFTYDGASGGAASNSSWIDKLKSILGITSGGSASTATPSWTWIIVGLVAVLLLLVAAFGFSFGAGEHV